MRGMFLAGVAVLLLGSVALPGVGSAQPAPAPAPAAQPKPTLSGAALTDALKKGGYVLYVRHAGSVPGGDAVSLGACSSQVVLSEAGRADAVAAGRAIKRLGIPVGQVLTGPSCRAEETAALAFGAGTVEPDLALLHDKLDAAEKERLSKASKALMSKVPPAGTNTALVSHSSNELLGFQILPAETAVLKPDGSGFTVVARVMPTAWDNYLGEQPEYTPVIFALKDGMKADILLPGKDGVVWVATRGGKEIGRLDSRTGQQRSWSLGRRMTVEGMALGEDGMPMIRTELGVQRLEGDKLKSQGEDAKVDEWTRARAVTDASGRIYAAGPGGLASRGGRLSLPAPEGQIATVASQGADIWVAQPTLSRLVLFRHRGS